MPSDPVSLNGEKTQSWAVTVERNGESVVTLASNCLGGRDLSEEDERVIRLAAQNLLSFIGEAHVPSPVSSTGAEQETLKTSAENLNDAAAIKENRTLITACEDCGLPYQEFPLDTVMPDADWLQIHPSGEGGLLCAGCIAKRVAALPDSIVLFARIVPNRDHDAFRQLRDIPWQALRDSSPRTGSEGWQPIETAPLETCRGYAEVIVVWNGQPHRGYYQDPDGWFAEVDGELLRIDPPPTHWIPSPPAGSASEGAPADPAKFCQCGHSRNVHNDSSCGGWEPPYRGAEHYHARCKCKGFEATASPAVSPAPPEKSR